MDIYIYKYIKHIKKLQMIMGRDRERSVLRMTAKDGTQRDGEMGGGGGGGSGDSDTRRDGAEGATQ